MRILVTGGSGVLGRALIPLLQSDGHTVIAPSHADIDLFDAAMVRDALTGIEAVYHLATRIPPPERVAEPDAWAENDRLRSEATRILIDAALAADVATFVLPSITFLYPAEGEADETTPIEAQTRLQSMVNAEQEVERFQQAGRHGVILRFGLLWGPGTGNDAPAERYGATVHIEDAGAALRLALTADGGLYNVVRDGERISNARFKSATGWQPRF